VLTNDHIEKVYLSYRDSLEYPDGCKNKPQFDICPIGLVGAGKSTVLRKICKNLPLVRISSDELRRLLIDEGLDPKIAPSLGARMNIELKHQGYSIAQDNDLAPFAVQKAVEKIDRELGITEFWIHINPPEEFIIHKLQNYKHDWLFEDANQAIANYFARKDLHARDVTRKFDFVFDTSRDDLDEQVNQFVELAKSRLSQKLVSLTN